MPSGLTNPAAYHILSYGTLLGTSIFQSFIGGIVSYRALTRPQFAVLQQNLFPIYFGMQTLLPLGLALTYPFTSTQRMLTNSNPSSISIATMTICGLVNWVYVGPATTQTMRERKHQETRDGKKYWQEGDKSVEMQRLNKRFSVLHGVSSLINLVGVVATVYYGFVLGERLG